MSYTANELLKLASDYDNVATRALVVTAKKKEKKKLDPKAKIRNRGTVCVPAESAKDKKDHFPINNEAQARNALARVNQFSKVPDWYSGSLQGLVSLVARKVKSKYPSIEISKDAKKPGKKKASEYYDIFLAKFAQGGPTGDPKDPFGLTPPQPKPGGPAGNPNDPFGLMGPQPQKPEGPPYSVDPNKGQPNSSFDLSGLFPKTPLQQLQTTLSKLPAQKSPGYSRFPTIDPTLQTMLGVNPDESLGPMTQSALEMFKKSVGLPYGKDPETRKMDSNKNNQQAIAILKSRPEYKTKSRLVYDDTNDVYKL